METGTVGGDVCFTDSPPAPIVVAAAAAAVFFFFGFFFFFFAGAAVPLAPGVGVSSSSPDSSSLALSTLARSLIAFPFTASVSFASLALLREEIAYFSGL